MNTKDLERIVEETFGGLDELSSQSLELYHAIEQELVNPDEYDTSRFVRGVDVKEFDKQIIINIHNNNTQ